MVAQAERSPARMYREPLGSSRDWYSVTGKKPISTGEEIVSTPEIPNTPNRRTGQPKVRSSQELSAEINLFDRISDVSVTNQPAETSRRVNSNGRYVQNARREMNGSGEGIISQHPSDEEFEHLYKKYATGLLAFSGRRVGYELAEDITQEILLKAWRSVGQFDGERGDFASWLFSIARNTVNDELRRRQARPQIVYEVFSSDGSVNAREYINNIKDKSCLEEDALRSIQVENIRQALLDLPESQRIAVELAHFHGFTQQEIADRLGEPIGTIKTRLRLGVAKLRIALSGEFAA